MKVNNFDCELMSNNGTDSVLDFILIENGLELFVPDSGYDFI